MVRHIVLFKIKPEYKQDIPALIEGFYRMRGQIEGLLDLEAGADFLGSDRSYDLALSCLFESRAALDAYQGHPAHLPVKARMGEVRVGSVACDYDVPEQ